MVRGIILYYLNIKPTHGYEIQQFISLSGIDQWTNIKSGSIYYALAKLEKEKNIAVQREERTGSRVRKIYEITAKGRETLVEEMRQELAMPLFDLGSAKFITSPILSTLSKKEVEEILEKHIKQLQKNKEYWAFWSDKKVLNDQYGLTKMSFQMTIDSIEQQIKWHEELLQHLDYYMEEAGQMGSMIASFDFDQAEDVGSDGKRDVQIEMLESIKQTIEKNPEEALENINFLLEQMKK